MNTGEQMSGELKKKIHSAKCQHCGKVTDISLSGAILEIKVQNQSLSEELREQHIRKTNLRNMKNGQIPKKASIRI